MQRGVDAEKFSDLPERSPGSVAGLALIQQAQRWLSSPGCPSATKIYFLKPLAISKIVVLLLLIVAHMGRCPSG